MVPTGALLGWMPCAPAPRGRWTASRWRPASRPHGLAGAPYLVRNGIDVLALTEPTCVFEGTAFDAAPGFPANVNVAAALALAGIGPVRTRVAIWADPGLDRNVHTVRVESEAARLTMTIENVPRDANPRTGRLTPLSVIACLRGLVGPLKIGS